MKLASPGGRCLATVVCCAVAVAGGARADAYDAALAKAIGAKEAAIQSNAPADWEAALRAMHAVETVRTTRETRYEIGVIAAHLRADDLAFEAFEGAVGLGLVGPGRTTAELFLDQHRAEMGRVRVRGPAGARVVVLQRVRAVLPSSAAIVVFAGTVTVGLEGVTTATRTLVVPAGTIVDVDFASPSSPAALEPPRPEGTRPWTWSLVVTGGAVAGSSLAAVVLASIAIPRHRSAIVALCPPEKLDGDRCLAAPQDVRDTLVSERSALLTWSAVRTGGFVGLGLGVALATVGVVRLSSKPATAAWIPVVQTATGGAYVGLQGTF